MSIKLRDYQQECINTLQSKGHGRYLVQMATGLGKCFARGTGILMYNGEIKNVEDLKPNDLVMGWDNTPRRIVSLARGREKMYEVRRKKHEPYTVNESHILSLKITGLSNDRIKKIYDSCGNAYISGDICNIEVKDYIKCSDTFKHVAKGFCMPVDFPSKEVTVDPYFLGVWLGDGTSRTLEITTPDTEVVEYLETFGKDNDLRFTENKYQNSGAAKTYSFTCGFKHNNPIRKYFKEKLFLNKHIPNEYIVNSKIIRLKLLAGLIDTDGYLVKGNNYEFCTQYESLQKQVAFLCRSLGFTAIEHKKFNSKYQKYYYYIIISGDIQDIPVRVERKKIMNKRPNKSNLVHGIEVVPVGEDEYFGFELEGKDRMFLLWDCTVAHNTVTFANLKRNGRMLILSHREELVRQPLKYFDCSTGIEMAADKSHGEEVVSASVQSIVHRLDRFDPDDFGTIIVDEAHHAAAKTYRKILDYFTPYQLIGFTATPNRADKARLNDVFDEIVFKRDLKWGIKNKYLCDIDCKRVDIGFDLRDVHTRGGDYAPGELSDAMDGTEDAIAEAYRTLAKGATLIFASSVEHAHKIADKIDGAVVVSAETKGRNEIIQAFTRREIPCLVNCMIFTEGTDIPLVETVMIARPTQSDSLYAQMVGRGLRLHPDKDKLTLIDCVGITGKRSLCTAPSLLGIDLEEIPKGKQKEVEGDLFELPELIERLADNPQSWIRNVETVDLWAQKQEYELHGINFFQMPNGDLTLSIPDRKFRIPAPDELGNTIGSDGKEYSMQEAIDMTYALLCDKYENDRYIWDLKRVKAWGKYPATEAQTRLIKRRCKKDIDLIDFDSLTKMQASMIINRIKN